MNRLILVLTLAACGCTDATDETADSANADRDVLTATIDSADERVPHGTLYIYRTSASLKTDFGQRQDEATFETRELIEVTAVADSPYDSNPSRDFISVFYEPTLPVEAGGPVPTVFPPEPVFSLRRRYPSEDKRVAHYAKAELVDDVETLSFDFSFGGFVKDCGIGFEPSGRSVPKSGVVSVTVPAGTFEVDRYEVAPAKSDRGSYKRLVVDVVAGLGTVRYELQRVTPGPSEGVERLFTSELIGVLAGRGRPVIRDFEAARGSVLYRDDPPRLMPLTPGARSVFLVEEGTADGVRRSLEEHRLVASQKSLPPETVEREIRARLLAPTEKPGITVDWDAVDPDRRDYVWYSEAREAYAVFDDEPPADQFNRFKDAERKDYRPRTSFPFRRVRFEGPGFELAIEDAVRGPLRVPAGTFEATRTDSTLRRSGGNGPTGGRDLSATASDWWVFDVGLVRREEYLTSRRLLPVRRMTLLSHDPVP